MVDVVWKPFIFTLGAAATIERPKKEMMRADERLGMLKSMREL